MRRAVSDTSSQSTLFASTRRICLFGSSNRQPLGNEEHISVETLIGIWSDPRGWSWRGRLDFIRNNNFARKNGVIAPGKAWGRGMRCNDYNSETFRWNPA